MLFNVVIISTLGNSKFSATGFNLNSYCVGDLYLRNLLPYKNKYMEKLNIFLIGDGEKAVLDKWELSMNKFSAKLRIGEIFLPFDFEGYLKLDDCDKRLKILDKIQEGFELFAIQTKTDIEPFRAVYKKCLEQHLINEYLYKESVANNGEIKIRIVIKIDLEKLEVVGIFYDKQDQKISERIFISSKPHHLFDEYLGDCMWVDNNSVTLFGRSSKEFWTVTK